jgi:AAA15 family ATPase/GTPase
MSKIQTIKISNFKAIEELAADFKGCTAIITGGNNTGKSSFLRGIPDRIRFIRPDVIVKKGATQGKGEMTLDSGEKFVWEFDTNGKDKLTYVTEKGIKSSVTVAIGEKFFPPIFDIDKFLQSTPKKQAEQLQQIIGIDFADIDARYKVAYDDRTDKNRDAEKYQAKLTSMLKVDKTDPVDLSELQAKKDAEKNRLNTLYLKNKDANDVLRKEWNKQKEDASVKYHAQLKKKESLDSDISIATKCLDELKSVGYDGTDVQAFIYSMPVIKEVEDKGASIKEPDYIPEMPDSSELDRIDAEILAASETNRKAAEYQKYIDQKSLSESASLLATEADAKVKSIELERQKLIESAKMPKGISITPDGITVDGLPLDRNQISTSKLYTSALRIASMNLGEVKTLYFDASFLDRNSLAEIEVWANENGLQLLIERPDFEGGEIKYEIIES